MTKITAFLTASILLLAACGGGSDEGDAGGDALARFSESCGVSSACPIFASSEKVVGKSRFLVGLINDDDAPIASPDVDVNVKFYDLGVSADEPRFERDLEFIWTAKPYAGVYVTETEFDRAGPWGAEVTMSGDGLDETIRQKFLVEEEPQTPALGEKVPASDTPTVEDAKDLGEISTDSKPDPRFYELSIADALERKEPFVVVFATPKFCETQFCGPTLEKVKKVSKDFPKINFIHSEIYEGLDPSTPVVPAVEEWGLPSEPWVFVIGADGRLVQKYEVAFTPQELSAELSKL